MALTSEVGDLNEILQWLTEKQSFMKDDDFKTDKVGFRNGSGAVPLCFLFGYYWR